MLQAAYAKYLRNGADAAGAYELSIILTEQFPSDAQSLQHLAAGGPSWFECSAGELAGKRVFVGPKPPDASPGALWFDSCDLAPMLLVPPYLYPGERESLTPEARTRLERENTWFALRPVARFQYAAFLEVAPVDSSSFARDVILHEDEASAVTGVSCGQASAYLFWFGKYFASETEWLAASELGQQPWSTPACEWVGESVFDDNYCVALSPSTLGVDPQETEAASDPECRMLYRKGEAPSKVTFRSAVPCLYGLLRENVASSAGPWRVGGRLARAE